MECESGIIILGEGTVWHFRSYSYFEEFRSYSYLVTKWFRHFSNFENTLGSIPTCPVLGLLRDILRHSLLNIRPDSNLENKDQG